MKKLVRLTAFATVVGVAAIVAGQAIAAPAAQPARSASHAKDDKFKEPKLKHGLLKIRGTKEDERSRFG